MRWTLAIAAAATLLAGCGGCYAPTDERKLVLSFVQPAPGAELSDADDADRTRPGLQYDVQVRLEWESLSTGERSPAEVAEAGLSLRRNVADSFFPEPVAGRLEDDGLVTFTGTGFAAAGEWLLRASAKEQSSGETVGPVTITVSVKSVPNRPQVLTSRVVQDVNGDGKVNAQELPPGGKLQVAFTSVNLPSGSATVTLADGTQVGQNSAANDEGLVTLTLPQAATEATYALTLKLSSGTLESAPSGNPPDVLTIAVDQVAPVVSLLEPIDRDGGYGTRSVNAVATVSGAEGATVLFEARLLSDAGTMDAGTATVNNGTATVAVSLFEGRQRLTAKVSDPAGNPGSDFEELLVNTGACQVQFDPPPYLGPAQDAAPADAGFQFDATGSAADCPNQLVRIQVAGTTFTGVTGPTGAFSVPIQLQPGQNSVRVDVDNGAGVFGTVVADVFVSSSNFVLTSPTNDAGLNIASDTVTSTPSIESPLAYTGTVPTGASVNVCANLPIGTGQTACADGTGWLQLAANQPPTTTSFTYTDGTYQVKAVMLQGGLVLATTPAVNVRVDSVRPLVTSFDLQNDADDNLKLNATEQATGDAVAIIAVGGLEAGRPVTVKARPSGAVLGSGTANAAGQASVTLSGVAGPEQSYDVTVEVVDAAGNANDTGAGSSALVSFRVDRVAPTVTLTQPTKTNLGLNDDGSTAAGYQIHVEGITQADAQEVRFSSGGAPSAGTLSGTTAAADLTVANTGTTAYTLTATATDTSGNTGAPAQKSVTVDLEPPTAQITSPNQASSPYSTYTILTEVAVPGGDGLTVTVYTTVQGGTEQLVDTMTVASGVASKNLSFPNGTQTVRVSVTDAAGNTGGDTEPIVIASPGCAITLTAPAPGKDFLNAGDDEVAATPSTVEYTVAGSSANCAGRPFVIYRGTGASRTVLASGVTSGSGAFSAQISLAEGAQHIEVELTDPGNVVSRRERDLTVDLSGPTVSNVAPADATVFYVAPSNVNLRGGGTAGYFQDGDPTTDGAQATFSFRATGALGGKAYVYYLGVQQGAALDIDQDPDDLTAAVTLAQATSGALEVRVEDAAQNRATHTKTATVDVVAPAAPAFGTPLLDPRATTINLSWPQVYDDGASPGSGVVAGFDLRWSNTVHLTNGVLTEDEYFNLAAATPQRLKRETGALLDGGISSYVLKVPPLVTSFVTLRAVDDLGNYSSFAPSTSVASGWTQATYSNPATNTSFAFNIASRGDLNADGFNDFVVAAPGSPAPGQAHVYFGKADLAALTPQGFGPSDGDATAQSFGYALDVGNVSHASPSTLVDVAVGAPGFTTGGRVYLYFGKAGASFDASAANAVIFQGDGTTSIGRGLAIARDFTSDGLGELLIAAPGDNANRGRVYVFFGRDKASWDGLRVSGTIPMSKADRIIEGPTPVGGGSTGNAFGWARAFAPLGVPAGGTQSDFAVAASGDATNKVFVFSGSTVAGKTASTGIPTLTSGDAPGAADESKLRLTVPATENNPNATNGREGFGSRMFGGVDVLGGAESDLVVAFPYRQRVNVYAGAGGTFSSTPSTTISGSPFLGTSLVAADINGDGPVDLLASDTVTGASSVWLFLNSGVAGQEFDGTTGVGFQQSRLPSTSSLGRSAAVADINNDNKVDIVVGDTTTGRVLLWY